MPLYLRAIGSVIAAFFGLLLNAEQQNRRSSFRDDGILPRRSIRQKKTAFLFIWLPKHKPIRWRVYWRYRITYFSLLLYASILVVGWCIHGSLDFIDKNNTFMLLYMGWMVLAQVLFELCVDLYVVIQKIKQKRK